jgi:hypothetical protein
MAGLRNAIFAILIALVCVEAKLLLQRNHFPDSFRKLSLARPDQLHEFRLALKQRNLNILEVIKNFLNILLSIEDIFDFSNLKYKKLF